MKNTLVKNLDQKKTGKLAGLSIIICNLRLLLSASVRIDLKKKKKRFQKSLV